MANETEEDAYTYRISEDDIYSVVIEKFASANTALANSGVLPSNFDQRRLVVGPPSDPSHGDFASNDALILAKQSGKKPRELAEEIVGYLRHDPTIERIDVAGPGFINLTLKPAAWTESLRKAVKVGLEYGRNDFGRDKGPVNVEYVSANPTGPMHVGHGRGAVFGDALASLLAFTGFEVSREYYVNDAGAQIDALARSLYLRYCEALGEDIGEIPEGLYPGEYLKPIGETIAKTYGDLLKGQQESQRLGVLRKIAIHAMMQLIREDLLALGISQDRFFSEESLVYQEELGENSIDFVGSTIDWLRQQGYVYEGRLPPPKGAPIEDWEDREQTLFRSKAFGDVIDRPLKKSDGSYTYFASDIAYHANKIGRGFRTLIDVWGADHGGYIKRMQAAVAALSGGKSKLDVKVIQLVKLLRAGEPVKMSKRAGEFVTLREVVDEVGRDAVRFMMLFRKNDAVLDFDLAKVREQSRDNPVFYVQYGHARAQSIFRNAQTAFPDLPRNAAGLIETANLTLLSDPTELSLMRLIAHYPRRVHAASVAHEPHRIAFYLFDLASEFHALYTLGNASPHLRFIIQNDRQLTEARLVLVQAVATVLASGLRLLGVAAPDEMR
ncbi:MAG TPA: arginine--tRNA ligase [Xanthobacteraceae bacterium]|nr:arginine--tRNA ligase [Xanthobacteraceae bacterium]